MDRVARFGLSFTGTRKSKREKIFEPVTIVAGVRQSKAHLLDLSLTGALGHADAPPAVGTLITVLCVDEQLKGSVVWIEAKHFGISFDPALEPDTVQRVFRQAVRK
ncbi:MAG: PilZ domain-containing protein [Sphingomonadaceae bacterium]|nr:PilZ domain-containing protein [Sphingomonadaceae bacterium]